MSIDPKALSPVWDARREDPDFTVVQNQMAICDRLDAIIELLQQLTPQGRWQATLEGTAS